MLIFLEQLKYIYFFKYAKISMCFQLLAKIPLKGTKKVQLLPTRKKIDFEPSIYRQKITGNWEK